MSQKNHIWPAYVDMMTVLLLVYILMNCMFSVIISNADLDKTGSAASGSEANQVSAAGRVEQNAAAGRMDATKASSDHNASADKASDIAAAQSGTADDPAQAGRDSTQKLAAGKADQSAANSAAAQAAASNQKVTADKNPANTVSQSASSSNTADAGLMDKEKLAAGKTVQSSAAGAVSADSAASDERTAASSAKGSVSTDTHNSDNAAEAGNSTALKHASGNVAQTDAAGRQADNAASSGNKANVTAAAGAQDLMFLQAYKDLYNNKPGDLQIKFTPQQESYLDSDKAQVVSWLGKYKGKNGTYAVGVFVHDAGGKSSSSQLVQQTSFYYQLMAIFKAQGIDLSKVDIKNAAPSNDIDNVVKARFIPCQGECAVQSGQ